VSTAPHPVPISSRSKADGLRIAHRRWGKVWVPSQLASTLGLHQLVGLSVKSVGDSQTLERQHAGNHDVAARASEKNRAILFGPPFENRYDEDKALERIECENCGDGVILAATMRLMIASPVPSSPLLSPPNDFSGPREHCKEPRARVRRPCSTDMKCLMNGVEAQ
jgi:hypothetical protein